MKKSLPLYLFLFLLILLPVLTNAQSAPADTSFLRHSVSGAIKMYKDAVGLNTELYNGPEYYTQPKPYLEGHQFFVDKTLAEGDVYYNGAWYDGVSILYDVVQDEVITFHPGNGIPQKLVKEKIDTFLLKDHLFVNLEIDSTIHTAMRPGFYDLLYAGDTKALARREKNVQERVTIDGLEGRYDTVVRYYIYKEGTYHQVNSKRSMLKVLADEKKQLQKFARANKLKFRNRREEAILKLASYYDSLKKE